MRCDFSVSPMAKRFNIIVLVYVKFNHVLEIGKSTIHTHNWYESKLVRIGTNLLSIDSSNSDGFTLIRSAAHTPIDTVFLFVRGPDGHWSECYLFNVRRIQSWHKHRTNNMENKNVLFVFNNGEHKIVISFHLMGYCLLFQEISFLFDSVDCLIELLWIVKEVCQLQSYE